MSCLADILACQKEVEAVTRCVKVPSALLNSLTRTVTTTRDSVEFVSVDFGTKSDYFNDIGCTRADVVDGTPTVTTNTVTSTLKGVSVKLCFRDLSKLYESYGTDGAISEITTPYNEQWEKSYVKNAFGSLATQANYAVARKTTVATKWGNANATPITDITTFVNSFNCNSCTNAIMMERVTLLNIIKTDEYKSLANGVVSPLDAQSVLEFLLDKKIYLTDCAGLGDNVVFFDDSKKVKVLEYDYNSSGLYKAIYEENNSLIFNLFYNKSAPMWNFVDMALMYDVL